MINNCRFRSITKVILLPVLFFIFTVKSNCQDVSDKTQKSSWNFEAISNFYLLTDDFLIIPEFNADYKKLHLEARYNYEDAKTVSLWGGYNILFGKKLVVSLTPMAAPVLGSTNGIAPGLELSVVYKKFSLYSESEYLFNFKDGSLNYFYNWSEISFSPLSWCSVGFAAQRTLAYSNDNDIQYGVSAGLSYINFSAYTYYFNIGSEDDFIMISALISF